MDKLKDIRKIAKKINLKEKDLILYGTEYAKINYKQIDPKGKLILITSINPTPYGEGKTTLAIGINDALRKCKKNSIAVLREPSMGPVFGKKGGATGGGMSTILPSDDINLHFTGDMHAITYANNLICAMIDNHIYHGNELQIDPNEIYFHRCLDINDRALRKVKLENRDECFNITAASEMMAIFCLADSIKDLEKRLNNILIALSYDKKPIYFSDFKATKAIIRLLQTAFLPNLVQSKEGNPVIVHGGPFANIAHGCNSLIATKLGLTLCNYVITEAGFGSDLGAVKFFDIKCRCGNLKPDLVIINVTLKAIKYHGNGNLKKGIENLEAHIRNMKLFSNNLLVVLNKFEDDKIDEIDFVKEFVKNMNTDFEISTAYLEGSDGAINIAKYIINLKDNSDLKELYDLSDNIEDKINIVCTKIFHSNKIKLNKKIKEKIKQINELGYNNLPICIAKTPLSFSADSTMLGNPTNYDIEVKDIELKTGSEMIVVYLGKILTMPGLPKEPNILNFK